MLAVAGLIGLGALPSQAADLAVLHNGFSIRHERREVVGGATRLYLASGDTGYIEVPSGQIDHFEHDPTATIAAKSPTQPSVAGTKLKQASLTAPRLDEVISEASRRQRLDPDLVSSVIRAESNFNFRAVSPKGAQGLMQLMPKTASQLGVTNAFDPKANVEGGAQYLRTLLEQYNFDMVKALAAYNAGPQRVTRYGGVPPYYETQAYVAHIVRDFNRKKLAEKRALAAKTKPAKVAVASSGSSSALTQRAAR